MLAFLFAKEETGFERVRLSDGTVRRCRTPA